MEINGYERLAQGSPAHVIAQMKNFGIHSDRVYKQWLDVKSVRFAIKAILNLIAAASDFFLSGYSGKQEPIFIRTTGFAFQNI